MKLELTPVFAVMSNTDRTEGRGNEYVITYTEIEATALRIGKGRYVQGTDCPVEQVQALVMDGVIYKNAGTIVLPTPEDLQAEKEKTLLERWKEDPNSLGRDELAQLVATLVK